MGWWSTVLGVLAWPATARRAGSTWLLPLPCPLHSQKGLLWGGCQSGSLPLDSFDLIPHKYSGPSYKPMVLYMYVYVYMYVCIYIYMYSSIKANDSSSVWATDVWFSGLLEVCKPKVYYFYCYLWRWWEDSWVLNSFVLYLVSAGEFLINSFLL